MIRILFVFYPNFEQKSRFYKFTCPTHDSYRFHTVSEITNILITEDSKILRVRYLDIY